MNDDLLEQIALAERNIEEAELALEEALDKIVVAPRADKTTVSEAVQAAFDRLRAARAILHGLKPG